ncbi:D-glycerate 3-kinase, chloroplastic [Glycine soja]
MATLNLFSQPWQPTISPFCCSNTNNNNNVVYAYHNHNNSKLHFFSNSRQFSVLSQLSTNSSKSVSGSSGLQNSSFVSGIEYRKRPLYSVFPTKPAQVSSVEDLYEFICSGPLLDKIGITQEQVAESIDNWLLYGRYLCRLFQLNELFLTEPQKARIYHYYVPVFLWCEQQITEHQSKFKDGEDIPPLVIGFSAPQGCGKTTLVFALDYLFEVIGRKSATVSIDDFYLMAEGQNKLREANPGNALLELRGNAGSHDLAFSVETLTALTKLTREGMKLKLPRYDKFLKANCLLMQSAFNGRGDRADPSTWSEVEGPLTLLDAELAEINVFYYQNLLSSQIRISILTFCSSDEDNIVFTFGKNGFATRTQYNKKGGNVVVLFEGWMLGFKPLPVDAVKVVDPQLETVNKNLEAYYDAWDKYIKSWIVIKIKNPNCVFQWRLQAEIAMREAGKPGMTDDEVRDFVSRYLPAYYAYLPTLYSEGPNGSDPQHLLTIEIDEGRNPILAT